MSARSPFLRQLTVLMVLVVLTGAVALGMQMVEAQGAPETEEISLSQGSVFEVLAQEGAAQTQYAWVLSLERTFLQAARGRTFRTRFTAPGRYLLSAEIVSPGSVSIRRSFAITVKQDAEMPPSSGDLLETDPPNVNGTIVLRNERQLVLIRPALGALQSITLDADLSLDENGDGNLENDPSAEGTFLATERLPLYLWITKDPPASFAIAGTSSDGAPLLRQFTAISASAPSPAPDANSGSVVEGGIAVTEERDGSLRFRMSDLPPAQTPTLPVWDFGDGTQSMVMEPVHGYASSGTYVVRVRLKDLRNGVSVRDLTQTVTVRSPDAVSDPEKPVPEPEKPTPEETPSTESSLLPWLLKILAGLVVTVIIGAAVTVAALKLRKGKSLAERLEEADKKMAIGKEIAGSAITAPAPMSLQGGQTGVPEIVTEKPKKTVSPPPATAVAPKTPGPVPSWLQTPAQTPASSVPPPQTPQAAPKPASAPSAPAPTPLLSDAAMPDWLTPNTQKKAAPAPVSALPPPPTAPTPPPPKIETPPKEAPKATPISTPIASPKETIAQTPAPLAPAAGALPAWLQPSASPAVQATPSTPAPVAPAPVPVKTETPAPVLAAQQQPTPPKNDALPPVPAPIAPKPMAPAPEKQSSQEAGALPTWLQPQPQKPVAPITKTEVPAPGALHSPEAATPSTNIAPATAPATPPPPPPKSPTKPETPTPVAAPTPTPTPASVPQKILAPPSTPAPASLSDKERERRRLKRQRYRQNKQRRETEAAAGKTPETNAPAMPSPKLGPPDDAPVAFIRAENIDPNPNPSPNSK